MLAQEFTFGLVALMGLLIPGLMRKSHPLAETFLRGLLTVLTQLRMLLLQSVNNLRDTAAAIGEVVV
ncbi:hypothetical protein AF381_24440, partial [Salmonella enterica subsp. enterica serovar Typhimurium]